MRSEAGPSLNEAALGPIIERESKLMLSVIHVILCLTPKGAENVFPLTSLEEADVVSYANADRSS